MKTNEKGMTLVEVLVTFVIASIFMGIIYGVVIMAMNYNSVETTKTKLQQEANYIVTELQRIHRKGNCYFLSITESEVSVAETDKKSCLENDSEMRVLSSSYTYSFNNGLFMSEPLEVNPTRENVKLEKFTIQDSVNEDLKVVISTVLSRYKSNTDGGQDDEET